MITIKNWDKLVGMFKSKIDIRMSEMHYLINYYYPTLPSNQYYTITLSRMNPPQQDHPHKTQYLMLCGEESYWLSKKQLEDIDVVYEAIVDVVVRHNIKVMV